MGEASSGATWLRVVLSWLLVLAPLGWGVYQSVMKSLPLFGLGRG